MILPTTFVAFVDVRFNTKTGFPVGADELDRDFELSSQIFEVVSNFCETLSLKSQNLEKLMMDSIQHTNLLYTIYENLIDDLGGPSKNNELPTSYSSYYSSPIFDPYTTIQSQKPILFIYVFNAYNKDRSFLTSFREFTNMFNTVPDTYVESIPYIIGYVGVYDLKSYELYYYNKFYGSYSDLENDEGGIDYLRNLIFGALPDQYEIRRMD